MSLRTRVARLLEENLSPGRAAAAVFIGVFIGVTPIYGLQSAAAIGLAIVLRLNKPLTLAATFVNNPLLQPLLVLGSIEIGYLALAGAFLPLSVAAVKSGPLRAHLAAWVAGSLILGLALGALAALAAWVVFSLRLSPQARRASELFRNCPAFDRGFVRWKLRLDRIFGILSEEDLGEGLAVDLGCGHGTALALAAVRDPARPLAGCDLDARRIAVARQALNGMRAEVAVADARSFEFGGAGLVMIFDVLQYMSAGEQAALLERCCRRLVGGGVLLVRVPDASGGLASRLSLAFDKLIFFSGGVRARPVVLARTEYRALLEGAGLRVQARRIVNRLPLAHILFRAVKP